MSNLKLSLDGDWARAKKQLEKVGKDLYKTFKFEFSSESTLTLQIMKGHIDNQDLGWTPLSKRTITLKGGDSTIYMETGTLYSLLNEDIVKETSNRVTHFIGATNGVIHKPSGEELASLLMWLEYGTDKIPPRPLIEPTLDEVEKIFVKEWKKIAKEVLNV